MYDYQLGLYEKAMPDELPLTEKLLTARELGFDYMELCVDMNPQRAARLDWTREERRELMDFMARNGLRFVTLSMSVLRRCPLGESEEMAAEFLQTMEKGLQLACDLGARVLLFNGYDTYNYPSTEETRARYHKYLPQVVALAAKYGVIIALENAEKEFVDSVAKAAALVDEINSPWLRIYADMANTANAMGGDADKCVADIQSGRGRISAMHLKDSVPGDYRFPHYGKGHVNFERSVALCKELGIRIFTIELFHYPDVADYKAKAAEVKAFVQKFF